MERQRKRAIKERQCWQSFQIYTQHPKFVGNEPSLQLLIKSRNTVTFRLSCSAMPEIICMKSPQLFTLSTVSQSSPLPPLSHPFANVAQITSEFFTSWSASVAASGNSFPSSPETKECNFINLVEMLPFRALEISVLTSRKVVVWEAAMKKD